jgi:hypothetical protein
MQSRIAQSITSRFGEQVNGQEKNGSPVFNKITKASRHRISRVFAKGPFMQYEIEPDELVLRLTSAIDHSDINWENSTLWTKTIKRTIRSILQRDLTEVIFTEPENQVSEFMLDIVGWNRQDGEGIVLAVECEWGYKPSLVLEDFEKLLVVKSATKLMIFSSTSETLQRRIIEVLKDSLLRYKHHMKGERYIFVDFAPAVRRMAFWIEVVDDGRMTSIPLLRQVKIGNSRDAVAEI